MAAPLRIAALEPFLADLVVSFGLSDALVAVPGGFDAKELGRPCPVVTNGVAIAARSNALEEQLASSTVDITALVGAKPNFILTSVAESVKDAYVLPANRKVQLQTTLADLKKELDGLMKGQPCTLAIHAPRRFDDIIETFEKVGAELGVAAVGHDRGQRMKAQVMNWADNFYERTRGKKVTFLSSVEPLALGGLWIPDLLRLMSTQSQHLVAGDHSVSSTWEEIKAFHPDVIFVAPQHTELAESAKTFHTLSKLPGWDEVLAVVRGEVVFAPGNMGFYRPSMKLMDASAALFSGIAGFDSGYITPRDSFYRLRWLELNRHKI